MSVRERKRGREDEGERGDGKVGRDNGPEKRSTTVIHVWRVTEDRLDCN